MAAEGATSTLGCAHVNTCAKTVNMILFWFGFGELLPPMRQILPPCHFSLVSNHEKHVNDEATTLHMFSINLLAGSLIRSARNFSDVNCARLTNMDINNALVQYQIANWVP